MKNDLTDREISALFDRVAPDKDTTERMRRAILEKAPAVKVKGFRNNILKAIAVYAVAASAVFAVVLFILPLFGKDTLPPADSQSVSTTTRYAQTTTVSTTKREVTTTAKSDDNFPSCDENEDLWFDPTRTDKRIWQREDAIPEGYINFTEVYSPQILDGKYTLGYYDEEMMEPWETLPHQLIDGYDRTALVLGGQYTSDVYFTFSYSEPVTPKGYTLVTTPNSGYNQNWAPRSFAILGTNKVLPEGWKLTDDNFADWEVVDIVYDMYNPAENTPPHEEEYYAATAYFDLPENTKSFTTYMFYLRCCFGYEVFGLGEIALYGEGAPVYADHDCTPDPMGRCTTCGTELYRYIYKETDGGILITEIRCLRRISEITIPDTINNLPVVGLGNEMFKNADWLKKIVLPDSLKTIGAYTFDRCTALAEIDLPENLTELNHFAFSRCTALKEIRLPASLKTVQPGVFKDCSALESVTFQGSLSELPYNIFENCYALRNVALPDGLLTINESAFMGCMALKSLDLPDTLTRIGAYAFAGCAALTDLNLPDSLTDILDGAFRGCGRLFVGDFEYTIGGDCIIIDKYIGKRDKKWIIVPDMIGNLQVRLLSDSVFQDNTAVRLIYLPDDLLEIGKNCFRGCTNLERINIPYEVYMLGEGIFRDCTSLTGIYIGGAVHTIPADAFRGCTALRSVILTESVMYIRDNAFADCTALTALECPESLKEIGDSAFRGCKNLESVTLPHRRMDVLTPGAFNDCPRLKTVYRPVDMKYLCDRCFENPDKIEFIILDPDNIYG